MKHIIRKPVLPLLLMAALIFGVCFMCSFRQGIARDLVSVEEMYHSTQLTYCVLPGTNSDGSLKIGTWIVKGVRQLQEVTDSYAYLSCPYSLREPREAVCLSRVYGTNDAETFFSEMSAGVSYAEGYGHESLQEVSGDSILCVADALLVEAMGIKEGDSFVIVPNDGTQEDNEKAPVLTMRLIGIYTDTAGLLEPMGIVAAESTFFSEQGFLFNTAMKERYGYYQGFQFDIDPVYNREFEQVEEKVKEIIGKGPLLYSNVRMLKQAVRPMEQKLALQQALADPLELVFCVTAGVVAMLMALGFQTEIFLRFMWGEPRPAVFVKMLFSAVVCQAVCGAAALAAALLISRGEWLLPAGGYLKIALPVCAAAAAVPVGISCGKNLIRLYQSREG